VVSVNGAISRIGFWIRLCMATVVVAVVTTALGTPSYAPAVAVPDRSSLVAANDPRLRYEGHWGRTPSTVTTVNSGSRLLFRFSGQRLSGLFDTTGITEPAQIYVWIDGGQPEQYTVDRSEIDFTPVPLSDTAHQVELAVKDVSELANRWSPPMQSALGVTGFRLASGGRLLAPPPAGKINMEFYGDSITQGVLATGPFLGPNGSDGTKSFAYLTARAFQANANQVGFGAQGVLRGGNGGVPAAGDAFGWNYAGSPASPQLSPDVVVVNQGQNDSFDDPEPFRKLYAAYLSDIRAAYPDAWIFALRPFGFGGEVSPRADDIRAVVGALADPHLVYVDTTGWLNAGDFTDQVHPTVAGHRKAADRLIPVIRHATGLATDR
jgi:lysophospholipase L1-like esterase